MAQHFYEAQFSAREPLGLRPATKADLDCVVWIVKEGFPDDPGCDYKFPYRHEHMNDFLRWTKREYENYLEQPEKFAFLVVTTPVIPSEQGRKLDDMPIAIAVWDIAVKTESTGGDRGAHQRKDINIKHFEAYNAATARGFDKYLERYGTEQLHLYMLITHPQYRRRGAGTMLCNWGLKQCARRENCVLTLMASPMGRALYENLGYCLLGTERAQIPGEKDFVDIDVMQKSPV